MYTAYDYPVVKRNMSVLDSTVSKINDLCAFGGQTNLHSTQAACKHEHSSNTSITVL